MQIYRSIEEFKKVENSVLTIGTFDGVHAGHKDIISRLKSYAEKNNLRDVVITFEPHPRTVVSDFDIKLFTLPEACVFDLNFCVRFPSGKFDKVPGHFCNLDRRTHFQDKDLFAIAHAPRLED